MENKPEIIVEEVDLLSRYRESHHAIARMFAAGMTTDAIRKATGFASRRLILLTYDPTFQELVSYYRKKYVEKFEDGVDAYTELALGNMMAAERQLSDKLDAAQESGDFLPTRELISIAADRADRFGYSKHTTVRVEHDFAALMDKAIARSKRVSDSKIVEGEVVASLPPPRQEPMPVLEGDQRPSKEVAPARPTASPKSTSAGGGRPSFSEVLIKRRKVA